MCMRTFQLVHVLTLACIGMVLATGTMHIVYVDFSSLNYSCIVLLVNVFVIIAASFLWLFSVCVCVCVCMSVCMGVRECVLVFVW